MKGKHSRGNKRSNVQVIDTKKRIFELLPKHTDIDIMEILKMPIQTYYRYKSQIFAEAKEVWSHSCGGGLEYRALQLDKSLHTAYNVCESIALNEDEKAENRLSATSQMFEIRSNELKLLVEIPRYILENEPTDLSCLTR